MSYQESLAIVLRVVAFSETSCIVTLMTREYGKITAIAKGARRPKSPFEGAIDVLATIRVVFIHKSSGTLDLLTEAKLERRFRSAQTDLRRLYAGYYVVELLRTLVEDQDPHPEVFDLAIETLRTIDDVEERSGEPINLSFELLKFEIHTLKWLGHLPMLTQCVGCGRRKETNHRASFGLNVGGLLCPHCRRGQSNVVSLSAEAIGLLNKLARNAAPSPALAARVGETREPYSDVDRGRGVRREVRKVVSRYIAHLLGFSPRLHHFINEL